MKEAILIAAASLFGLASCATKDTEGLGVRCDVGPVVVTVTDDKYVGVVRDPIIVKDKNKWICWQLDPAVARTYKFVPGSIFISDTHDEFSNCKKGGQGGELENDTRIACHDKNNKHGEAAVRYYKYGILVARRDGRPGPEPFDPMIGND